MSAPLWVLELVDAFWRDAGTPEPFPRSLRRSVEWAVPLTVEPLSGLSLARVAGWLRARDVPCSFTTVDRPLRGCLRAHRDHGIAFLDADDPADEQRFTLAHELAHFLRHYRQPRRRAVARLGPQILGVLDGDRPPTDRERLHGLLGGVSIGVHHHLLTRSERSDPISPVIAAAEQEADRLAFELLAPAELLRRTTERTTLRRRLCEEFGLPDREAERYARILRPAGPRSRGLLDRLRSRAPEARSD